jgi:hypothetical protein
MPAVSDEQPVPERTKWQIFASWWTQEKFLQDIVTRTVSAVLTLVIVYLFAVFSGYIAVPQRRITLGLWVIVLIGTPLMYFATLFHLVEFGRGRREKDWKLRIESIAGALFSIFAMLVLVITAVFLFQSL